MEVYQIGGIGDIEVDYLSIDNFYIDQLNTEYSAGELNDLLAQAEAIPADGWTAESYAALADACVSADELLRTTGCVIDADALKDAMQVLQKAMDGLEKEKELDGISIRSLPDKTVYRTGEALDLTGGVILAEYSDGTTAEIAMTNSMVSGFDSSKTGVQTLEVLYCGKTAQFEVEVLAETTPTPTPEPSATPAPTEVPGPDPDPSATPAPTQAPDTGSGTDSSTAVPQTGDAAPLAILVLALALCTGAAGLIVCKNKRRSK